MRFFSFLIVTLSLLGCHPSSTPPNTLTIGTIAGPETQLVEVAREVAQKNSGLTIKIVEFNDYNLPNEALQDGSIDANIYQHLPYLEAAIKAHHYDLEVLAKGFIYPAGLYSNSVSKLKALPNHAIIALPNDPSNEARALRLLQKAHLIKLKSTKQPSVADIVKNPKKLQFRTLDAAQLPRILPDVDAAVINTNFALPAGLNPLKNALIAEDKTSPYVNLIVIKRNTPKQQALLEFVKAFQSQAVKDKAKDIFGDAAIAAWS